MNDNNNCDNNRIRPELGWSVIELSNDLKLGILGNSKISTKKIPELHEIVAYHLVLPPNENFVSAGKNILRNRNWTLP